MAETTQERIDLISMCLRNAPRSQSASGAMPSLTAGEVYDIIDRLVAIERHLLKCALCGKRTTFAEATLRKFNAGRCGYCEGGFIIGAPDAGGEG